MMKKWKIMIAGIAAGAMLSASFSPAFSSVAAEAEDPELGVTEGEHLDSTENNDMVESESSVSFGGLNKSESEGDFDPSGETEKSTLWLVGDSTVCSFDEKDKYYPRYGYGTQIGNYLDGFYEIQNLAVSGTSSKSYREQDPNGYYTKLTSGLKAGDVLIIGFGHNDEKRETNRYTNPNGSYTTEGSFAKSLYDNYIKPAKDKSAEVILCTPIVRRNDSGSFSDSDLHIVATQGSFEGGDYSKSIRDLGADPNVNIPVVDLTNLTKTRYLSLGSTPAEIAAETIYLHSWTGDDPASRDNTHLNYYGANVVAYLLASAIKDQNATTLASHVNLDKGDPENRKAELLEEARNKDYVHVDYEPPTTKSDLWDDYKVETEHGDFVFHGTVFGETSKTISESNKQYFNMYTDTDGKMRIYAAAAAGKIHDTSDCFVMYYYPISSNRLFSFSAKAHINAIYSGGALNSQGAFGLVARDTMYIDARDKGKCEDYVVAGSLSGSAECNCFYRKEPAKLGGKAKFSKDTTIEAGKDYNLKIVYNGDGYECTFGDEPTQSEGYDFQLSAKDPQNVYVGLFATRYFDVSYSDIDLRIANSLTLSSNNAAWGNVIGGDSYMAGDTVALKPVPVHGFRFKEWKVCKGNVTIENDSFTMPNEDVEIQAVFEEVPASEFRTVVVNPEQTGGTVSIVPAYDDGKYTVGEIVTLTAVPDTNHTFKSWIVTAGEEVIAVDPDGSFTMPAEDVIVTAVFEKNGNDSGEVSPAEITLVVGQSMPLVPDLSEAGNTENVIWSVDVLGKKCVKLANGLLTAKKVTSAPAVVTAAVASGEASWSTEVTVIDPQAKGEGAFDTKAKIEGAKVSVPKQVKLQTGEGVKKETLKSKTISVKPSGKPLKAGATISWNVLDESGNVSSEVVDGKEIKDEGKGKYTVKAKGPGVAFIKWTALDSEKKEAAYGITKVVVTQPVSKVSVYQDGTELSGEDPIDIKIGQSVKLEAYTDSPTDGGKITWTAKGGGVRISKSGYLTATKATASGKTVTVTAKCGSVKSAEIQFIVNEPAGYRYVVLAKDQVAVKRGTKDKVVKLTGKTGDKGDQDKIKWEMAEDYKTVMVERDAKGNGKVTVSKDAEPGVYIVKAYVDGSDDAISTCEVIVVK